MRKIESSGSGKHGKEEALSKNAQGVVSQMRVAVVEWVFTFNCLEMRFTVDTDFQKNANDVARYILSAFPSIIQCRLECGSVILHTWAVLDPSIVEGLQRMQKDQLVIPQVDSKVVCEITLPNSSKGGRGTTLTVKEPKDITRHMKSIVRTVEKNSLMPLESSPECNQEVILPDDVASSLHNLANYEHGWDGDDGEVIEEEALEIGKMVLAYLHREKLPMPEIYGAPSGAVDFSWPTLGVIATIYGDELLIPKIPKEFDKGVSFKLDEEPSKAAIMVCNLIIPALKSEYSKIV